MRDWSFGFSSHKSSDETPAAADTAADPGETVASAAVIVPYARFLERRAWREKIAADFHHADSTSIDVQAVRSEALSPEAVPPRH